MEQAQKVWGRRQLNVWRDSIGRAATHSTRQDGGFGGGSIGLTVCRVTELRERCQINKIGGGARCDG